MNPKLLRPLAAETIGTLLFVFLGAGSVVMTAATGGTPGPLGIALAHGVGMAIIVSATMSISGGHMNPAVTFAIALAGKIDWRRAGAYVIAQLVGALLGAGLVKALLPAGAVNATLAGTPQLGGSVTFAQGIWIEAVLTFFLVSAVFGTAVAPDAPKIGGVRLRPPVFVGAPGGGGPPRAALESPPPPRAPALRGGPHRAGGVGERALPGPAGP